MLGILAEDIIKSGAMSEYYNPFTGEGMFQNGFLNWNMLAGRMLNDLEGKSINP
jgi:hypothetical protein